MTIRELDKKYFSKIDYLDLEMIISHVIKKTRSFILAHPEYELTAMQLKKTESFLKRRIKYEPLAYILGYKEFYGLEFKVNKNVLVPRPETELIIDEVLKSLTPSIPLISPSRLENEAEGTKEKPPLDKGGYKSTMIIDVGTGSGCIITTLAKLAPFNKGGAGDFEFFAIDISPKALMIAKQNAKKHNVSNKLKFFKGNLLEPILKNKKLKIENCKLIITANLPYLTPKQIKESPTIKREPRLALVAGHDGLKYYKKLIGQIRQLKNLRPDTHITIFCEIDHTQTGNFKKLIKKELPGAGTEVLKDMHCLDRLVRIGLSPF